MSLELAHTEKSAEGFCVASEEEDVVDVWRESVGVATCLAGDHFCRQRSNG